MYYIYRYLNDNEIIYIGITNNLKVRKSQHSINSDWYKEGLKYEYLKVDNKYIAKNFETYLINRDSPIGNKVDNNKYDVSQISFNIDENWIIYKENEKDKNINSSKYKLKKSLKKQKQEEEMKKTFEGFDDIFFNKRNLITDINYDKYGRLFITFESEDIRKFVINSNWLPRYVSTISYSESDDDNKVNIVILDKDDNWLEDNYRIKLNEIYDLLDIEKLNLNKQAGIKKEIKRLEEIESKLTMMINNNDFINLIRLKTWQITKVPINNLFLIAGGIEKVGIPGYGVEIIFKNQRNMTIYFDNTFDKNYDYSNEFDFNKYCFSSDKDTKLFYHKMHLSQIKCTIYDGSDFTISLKSEDHKNMYLNK